MKGRDQLVKRFDAIESKNLFISEITLAEFKFGVENSEKKEKNRKALENFLIGVNIVPIFPALDLYAIEKARPRKSGMSIDYFDLMPGVTSVTNSYIMVINNINHFQIIDGIIIEDWRL